MLRGSELEGDAADHAGFAVIHIQFCEHFEVRLNGVAGRSGHAYIVQVTGDHPAANADFQVIVQLMTNAGPEAQPQISVLGSRP